MRIVQPPPPLPVQRSFGFLPITVVVHPWRPRARTADCHAPRPRPRAARPEQLPLVVVTLDTRPVSPPPAEVLAPNLPPIRHPALQEFIPRRHLPGARPKSLGTHSLSAVARRELRRDMSDLAADGFYARAADGSFKPGPRYPKTFGDCETMVPRVLPSGAKGWCPFVACAMHLAYDVDEVTGAVKEMFPGRELSDLGETCAIRFALEGAPSGSPDGDGHTLERVGEAMNLVLESIRKVEEVAIRKVKRAIDRNKPVPARGWSAPDKAGRQTCGRCAGKGERKVDGRSVECVNCEGEGYRWEI